MRQIIYCSHYIHILSALYRSYHIPSISHYIQFMIDFGIYYMLVLLYTYVHVHNHMLSKRQWLPIGVQPYGCEKYRPGIVSHLKHAHMTPGYHHITNHINQIINICSVMIKINYMVFKIMLTHLWISLS